MNLVDYGTIEVCTDCYFAHHYGARQHDGQWYWGASDAPCEFEPLGDIADDFVIMDATCPNHETSEIWDGWTECPHCSRRGWDDPAGTGITEFSHRSCDGCRSHLAGARYRLALFKETA